MGHGHAHGQTGHGHAGHGHEDPAGFSNARLLGGILVNVGLTAVQIVVGIFAGSLSLVADALHNLSDAVALGIAWLARRIGARDSDERYTFGYKRAELIAALVNLTALIIIGGYLIYEAVTRLINPEPVKALWVMAAAAFAILGNVLVAALIWALAKGSLNARAAFLHTVTDAAASVAVLIGALAIYLLGWAWIDPVLTLLLAGLIIVASWRMFKATSRILMQGTPPGLSLDRVAAAICLNPAVVGVHHVHAWSLHEQAVAVEAHVTLATDMSVSQAERIRGELAQALKRELGVEHLTLEFEISPDCPSVSRSCHG